MLFIVSGRDKPNGLDARLEFRDGHRQHYWDLKDDLVLSGPYLDAQGGPIGSMIVMRADSQAAAEAHVARDPYVVNKVFETVSVSRWDWFMNRPEGFES